ncbi:MAG: hypothetical protein H7A40_02965 [Chlamydiales bacterium]|nr:hypothetical protein [Chlamydiales bacterium]
MSISAPINSDAPIAVSPELKLQAQDLGQLEHNGKTYKVSVVYTDGSGKVVAGPKNIDIKKVHELTTALLKTIPEIDTPAKIIIDQECVNTETPQRVLAHKDQTQEAWNKLYTALITPSEKVHTSPSNTSELKAEIILEATDKLTSAQKLEAFKQAFNVPGKDAITELHRSYFSMKNEWVNEIILNINQKDISDNVIPSCPLKLKKELLDELYKDVQASNLDPKSKEFRDKFKNARKAILKGEGHLKDEDLPIIKVIYDKLFDAPNPTETKAQQHTAVVDELAAKLAQPKEKTLEEKYLELNSDHTKKVEFLKAYLKGDIENTNKDNELFKLMISNATVTDEVDKICSQVKQYKSELVNLKGKISKQKIDENELNRYLAINKLLKRNSSQ